MMRDFQKALLRQFGVALRADAPLNAADTLPAPISEALVRLEQCERGDRRQLKAPGGQDAQPPASTARGPRD